MLVKDDVGKSKPCTVKLPPQGFVYGKPDFKIEHRGNIFAGEYEPITQREKPIKPIVDFKKFNKAQAALRNQSVRKRVFYFAYNPNHPRISIS